MAAAAEPPQVAAPAEPPAVGATVDIPWIIASEDEPWTLALAAPVAAHLRKSGPGPLVMAISSPPTREAEWLLSLTPGRRPIVLATSAELKLGATLQKRSPEVLHIGSDPGEASATVAKRFWNHWPEVVVARADDPEAVILGSALAAAHGAPILLCGQDEAGAAVSAALEDLSPRRLLVAVSDLKMTPRWIRRQALEHEILLPQALQHRLIFTVLRSERVRNVVVARAPDDRAGVGHTAWLAPYLSFARGGAVVLTHAHGPAVAEADVEHLIRRERLQPRTVTVLADYASIGYRLTQVDPAGGEDLREELPTSGAGVSRAQANATAAPQPAASGAAPAPPPHYIVRTEPFVPTQPDQLATLGVGRIPLESLGDASVFFARGLLRERLLAHSPPRILMVANSGISHRSLPLCETISRVTASEFKNFGVHVDEFYGRLTDSPDILTAARSANLILYEGHVSYQDLIDAPVLRRSQAEDYPLDEEDMEGPGTARRTADRDADPMPPPRVVMAEPTSRHMQGPLAGLPIVVLQSCESLDDSVLWRLDELGGVALIGSMTPIHSGCGSDLLNAAMSSMLYRGGTLGETLRDAQNYMFCVEDLKARRGHKEKAKGVRVALSFRLWGDPELQVLPMPLGGPRLVPVRAEWVGDDTLRIDVPLFRLPAARSEKYVASLYPNSQAAGLMKTEEGEPMKKISPVYYFCLPLPNDVAMRHVTELEPSRSDAKRVEARIDRSRGLLYLVYYPEQENPGESIVLHLKAAAGSAELTPEVREVTGKSNSVWTVLVLLVLGIGFLVVRLNLNLDAGDSDYRLTYTADFHPRQPDGRVAVPDARLLAAFPETTRFCQVYEPEISAPDMQQVRSRIHTAAVRKDIVLRATKTGRLDCTISFRIHLDRKGDWRQITPEAPLTPRERTTHLANAKGMTASSATALEMVNRLRDNHPGPQELVDRIFQACITSVEPAGESGLDTGDEALLHQKGSPLGRAEAFATLCRSAKFPARLVTGFEVKKLDSNKSHAIRPRTWVEVYVADPQKPTVERWVPYDPENGSLHDLDYNVVPVRRDGVDLIRVTNSTDLNVSYSIESIPPPPRTALGILDLRRLPGKLHEPIKVVLILPIGALFTALVRTIIGLRTFGTFSPTLLALAFVYNDWQSGLCVFFAVIATGFVSRTLLDRLKLLLVPRMGIILTMVVMLMVLGISVMNYFDWAPGGKTVLLPMVILTNLVERFYVTSEEDSIFEAVRLLAASGIMALAIYLLLSSPSLGNLLFYYPELHFFTVVALILIGRYTGYRLTELVRFRDLVHPGDSQG